MENVTVLHAATSDTREPWDHQYKYAYRTYLFSVNVRLPLLGTTYILCAFAFVATVCHALQLIRQVFPSTGVRLYGFPGVPRAVGMIRAISYVHLPAYGPLRLPSLNACIIIVSFFVSMVAWIFSIRPYYRENAEAGSPPLAIRSGLVAVSLFPFIFACALKINPISMLTGISHARLQIYHQSLAFTMFFFGWVHAIPFLWQHSHDFGYANLRRQYAEDSMYWTGTVSIALVGWIMCSSLGVFRNFSYRFFVVQHIVSVAALLGFLFAHVMDMLRSHLFLWVAVAMWIFSIAVRGSMVLLSSDFFASKRARVDIQTVTSSPLGNDDGSVRSTETVRISLSAPIRWRPGQHIYVRFPGFAVAQAHPFSIMSLPNRSRLDSQLVLLAKVHGGTTRKIFEYVQEHAMSEHVFSHEVNRGEAPGAELGGDEEKGVSVSPRLETAPAVQHSHIRSASVVAYLDGPYGYTTDPASYAHVVLFAGGTGISHIFPLAYRLLQRCVASDARVVTRRIRLVWTTHATGLVDWLASELAALVQLQAVSPVEFVLDVCVTGEESGAEHKTFVQTLITSYGVRIDTGAIIREELDMAGKMQSTSLAAYVCGPVSLSRDVGNHMARTNWDLARGRLGSLRDVYLDVESFAW